MLFICSVCRKSFSTNATLRRHIIQQHPGEDVPERLRRGIQVPSSHRTFICPECDSSYTFKSGLDKHMNMHREVERTIPCPVSTCVIYFSRRKALLDHISRDHVNDASDYIIKKKFSSFDDFRAWLQKEEERSLSRYVKHYSCSGNYYYVCHRSGKYVYRGQGLRQSKEETSCKIGHLCSSFILLQCSKGLCNMSYQSRHNHESEMLHQRIGKKKKKSKKDTVAELISETKREWDSLFDRLNRLCDSKADKSILRIVLDKLRECNSYVASNTCDKFSSCEQLTHFKDRKLVSSEVKNEVEEIQTELIVETLLSEEDGSFIVSDVVKSDDHIYSKSEIPDPAYEHDEV